MNLNFAAVGDKRSVVDDAFILHGETLEGFYKTSVGSDQSGTGAMVAGLSTEDGFRRCEDFFAESDESVVTPFLVLEEESHPLDTVRGVESAVWLLAPACLRVVGSDNVQES